MDGVAAGTVWGDAMSVLMNPMIDAVKQFFEKMW